MAAIASTATKRVREILTGAAGLGYAVAAVAQRENVAIEPVEPTQVAAGAVAAELAERTAGVTYPAVYVYCEGLRNTLKEKFRTFSGKAQMAAEVRVTHDRLEGVARQLELYSSAVTDVLDTHRGDWGGGMFFTGGYSVEYGPVKRGGKNFTQTARVAFEVDVSL
jgi:hypothetical protein